MCKKKKKNKIIIIQEQLTAHHVINTTIVLGVNYMQTQRELFYSCMLLCSVDKYGQQEKKRTEKNPRTPPNNTLKHA